MTLAFNSERFNASSFNRGLLFTDEFGTILRWSQTSYTDEFSNIIKWNNRQYTSEFSNIFKWNNRVYTSEFSNIFKWSNISGIAWPLTDYLYVKTVQDEYLFPEIIDGQISMKEGSIAEAQLKIKSFVPEDARCIFYLKGDARIFDGISRRCVEDSSGIFEVTIQEYIEILKPESDKGGQYLVRNDWHNVELQYLLSSSKPTDNNNTVGLLYMAKSAIPWEFFEIYNTTYNIFKFEYTGIVYNITEVFEDNALLTQRLSASALESNSGWYHDTSNKILYVRCTDSVYPYFHVISVPNIWDFDVPIRIGDLGGNGSTTLLYWETANGDVPYTVIKNLLTALGLEMESSIRNGVCYINVSSKIGSGTSSAPARRYVEGLNITKITQIDRADARSMVSGVMFDGYGQGAGAVRAGSHNNMGRGGRFIRIDDASIHSQATATNYADQYLEDHYLPAKRIKFTAPVEVGQAIDQRRLGDYIHVSLPSKKMEHDLRIQEILLKLKPLSMELVAGDKLISFESQIKAMRDAADKFRKHLEDEIEEFSWNWNENVDNRANRSNTFTITEDAVKIQKLELSCSTSFFRTDAMSGASGDEGGGAGDGTSGDTGEDPDLYAMTGEGEEHTHLLVSGNVGEPTLTAQVAASDHNHSYSSTSGTPSATFIVVSSVSIASISVTTGCCTGVACGSRFVTGVTGGSLTTTLESVASKTHTHSISGSTGAPSSLLTVASYDHLHGISDLELDNESSHRHPISGDGYNPTVSTDSTELAIDPSDKEVTDDWLDDLLLKKSAQYYTLYQAPAQAHSPPDPEMYLAITISGPGITGSQAITGSPFLFTVNDSIGPILIDNLVTQAGDYKVTIGLENKDYPTDKTHIQFSVQVNGKIFVDSIVKA